MVVAGLWCDRTGPRTPLLLSVALFAAGLIVAGTAVSMELVVVGRLVQGLGSGATTVALYVIVARVFPPALQPRIFGLFAAAWVVTFALQRWPRFVPVLLAAALLVTQLPIASQHLFLNRLTQTRESATTWRFFERLGEKRILIVTDRPNHFTIMDYGAMSFDAARRDPYIFTAFARHLFYDIYVIQQLELSTGMPRPGYELWPNRKLEPVLEFQNDANVLVRVSRLAH
jgi:MFS family permease